MFRLFCTKNFLIGLFLAYYGHEVMCYDALDWKEGFVEEKYIDLL